MALKVITTKLPSYLQTLLQDNYCIELVYQQGLQLNKPQDLPAESVKTIDDTAVSELDLTGTPLKVDLGGDDSVSEKVIQPSSWTTEEAMYCPISLSAARDFINSRLQSNGRKAVPIICICDGDDPNHTVVLGVSKIDNKITRLFVYVFARHSEDHEITSLEYMTRDHISSVTRKSEITFSVTKYYYVWAYNLRNCSSLQNSPYNGSVTIEVSSNELEMKSQTHVNVKANLQVIIGHVNSPVFYLWEELCCIKFYIDILGDTNLNWETTVLSEENANAEDTAYAVADLLRSNVKYLKKKGKELDLTEIRRITIFDKLWDILKKCRDPMQLRDAFQLFFEELAETQVKIKKLSNEDISVLSDIVSGISDGKIAVPTLTLKQCLELLVDLGLEKLKNDYCAIIGSFYSSVEEIVSVKWKSLSSQNVTNTDQNLKRRTRMTINAKSSITDLTNTKSKLSYVDSMHKVVELILLCKDHLKLSEDSFDHFCEDVSNSFIKTNHIVPLVCDIRRARLCEFSLNLLPKDVIIVENSSPTAWTVKMMSTEIHTEVTTVFYFSEHPIFPPAVLHGNDISFENSDGKTFYVTKLLQIVQKFGMI